MRSSRSSYALSLMSIAGGMIGGLAMVAATEETPAIESGCSYGTWEELVPARGIPDDSRPRGNTLLLGGRRQVVIANDRPLPPSWGPGDTLVTASPWLAVDLTDGQRIEGPPTGRLVFNPKAALDDSGRMHAVWAENDTLRLPFRRQAFYSHATSLRYGKYDWEDGWSGEHEVFRRIGDGDLLWSEDSSHGAFAVDDRGRGHLTLYGSDRTDRKVLFGHVLIDDGHPPRVTRLDSLGAGIQHAVIPFGDTVYVVYTDRPFDLRRDGTFTWDNVQVFVLRSLDAGRTWDGPVEVGDRLPGLIHPLIGFRDGEGIAHVVWAQGLEPDSRRQVIRHAWLEPGGKGWTESALLDPEDAFLSLDAVGDVCGSVHVVYKEWHEGETRLAYVRRSRQGWSSPLYPFTGHTLDALTLAADSTGVSLFGLSVIEEPADHREHVARSVGDRWRYVPVLSHLPLDRER